MQTNVCFYHFRVRLQVLSRHRNMLMLRMTTKRRYLVVVIVIALFLLGSTIYKRIRCNKIDVVTTVMDPQQSDLFSQTCEHLARLDTVHQARAQLIFQRRKSLPQIPDWYFIHSTRYCSKFIRTQGYDMSAPSGEERNFPLAFGVRVHDSVALAENLLRAVYRPHNVYCIDIDRASEPIVQTAMRGIVSCFPNVFVSTRYEDFVYRSFSSVETDLQCMRQLLSTGAAWRYYLNAVGTEFTLWTIHELVQGLKRINGTNDIEMKHVPAPSRLGFWRKLYTYFVSPRGSLQHLNITMYKGSSHNVFSREFVTWLLGNRTAQQIIDWSRETRSPDETLWATLNGLTGAPGGYMANSISNQTFVPRRIPWRTNDAFDNHIC